MRPEDGSGASGASPISASEALRQFGGYLTAYERREIVQYEAVHYAGQRCVDKVKSSANGNNDGYDTEEGEYIFCVRDHIAYRYEVLEELGSGAFGQVFKAIDHADQSIVAVKVIRNQRRVLQQAEQEISILQHVNDRDPKGLYGIVRMTDNFKFRGHVCISYELLGANLYDYLKAHDFFPMSLSLVRSIAARMLVALTFLARENIIHCDLKPENILLRDKDPSAVKVVDLGSASFDAKNAYMYIQSRFYRAPEVIMEQKYGKAIDWWSFGCILCELANGDPIFPGEDEKDQLGCIMEYLGPPPEGFVEASCARRRRAFFDEHHKPRPCTTRKGRQREPGSRSLAKFLGVSEDDDFLSFVRLFLQWDPSKRVAPREAMKHRWICDEFVFPNQSEEKQELSSMAKEKDRPAAVPISVRVPQETAAPVKAEGLEPATAGQASTMREAPADSLPAGAAHRRAQRSAPLPQPPTACTGRANHGTSSGDSAVPAGAVLPSRNASARATTRGATVPPDAKVQRPPGKQRHSGRLQRSGQRRSTDMANVEMPGAAAASPNHSTSLHSPSNAEGPLAVKSTRELMGNASGASSPASCTCQTATQAINMRPHRPRLADEVLSPEVLPPAVLRSSASPVTVTSPCRNAHSPEKGSPNVSHDNTVNAQGGVGVRDVHTRVLGPRRKSECSETKAGTADSFDRSGGTVSLQSLSRWSSPKGAVQLGRNREGSASLSARRDGQGSASPGVPAESPKGQAARQRTEYLINLGTATVLPAEAYQPVAVQDRRQGGESMLPSESPPLSECASCRDPQKVELALNCTRPTEALSESVGKSETAQVSLQPRGPSATPSGPSAVAASPLTTECVLRQRGPHCNMAAMRGSGAAQVATGSRCSVGGAAVPTSERPAFQPSGMRLLPPRQVLGRRSQPLLQSGAGVRGEDVVKPSSTTMLQLPLLKRYPAR
ncbi:hypothetical protein LSCM1_02685 [Leishmania martiniquensis]|uniref:dual-specificity kinase n=1 Tax=Leishmania martiniquensis TaxID=1580590 RepID=A0A836GC90_9TRYP|nr:hypothetical protein LSCM1_02685 [Leishmania martiniquensis]